MTRNDKRRPLRVGRPRIGGRRPWHTKIYGPTPNKPYRVTYRDPHSGRWRQLHADDLAAANEIFDNLEAWLDEGAPRQDDDHTDEDALARRDVAALATRLVDRLRDDGVSQRTLDSYAGVLKKHVLPVIGGLPVASWDEEDCRRVLRRARNAGLAPSSVQDVGKLLRALVNEAHRKPRWMARTVDPMDGVAYQAKSRYQGQGPTYVPPSARPESEQVKALCVALWHRGRALDRSWYVTMGLLAGFAGLRWSELIGLRPSDYRSDERVLVVSTAVAQTDAREFLRQPPKNGRIREVPVTATAHRWLARRVDQVISQPTGTGPWLTGGPGGLLFPGPSGDPWDRAAWRKGVFIPSARDAGWEMVGDRRTARGLMRGGRTRLPWRNLRHHAATWLHNTAGLPWEEVSHILGHHSVAFTLSTYVRRGSESAAEVRSRLDRF